MPPCESFLIGAPHAHILVHSRVNRAHRLKSAILGNRFGSLESDKIIIGSLESGKIGSLQVHTGYTIFSLKKLFVFLLLTLNFIKKKALGTK